MIYIICTIFFVIGFCFCYCVHRAYMNKEYINMMNEEKYVVESIKVMVSIIMSKADNFGHEELYEILDRLTKILENTI